MKNLLTAALSASVFLGSALTAHADQNRAAITDQSYQAGKYSGAHSTTLLANCPREYREMYRGDLYCRKPEYAVLARRDAACPDHVWGLYRGNLYCFGRR
jgi:hypothetical protein